MSLSSMHIARPHEHSHTNMQERHALMYATFSSPRRGYLCHDMRATLRGKQSLTEPPAGCAIESSSNRTKIDLIFPAQFIAHRQRINA